MQALQVAPAQRQTNYISLELLTPVPFTPVTLFFANAPKSDFEKQAAKQIAAGTEQVEVVEDGFYRRVGAIRLGAGCIACHDTTCRDLGRDPKFAGLVISIPLRDGDRTETDRGQGE